MKGKIEWDQQVVCPNRGIDLEVISTDPVELDWVYEQFDYADYEGEEDW